MRIVLPFAAGGVADTTARIVAEKLGDKLGQRFYVENQPGAGGIAAARTVISSPPDGYTLIMLTNGTAISVSLFEKLPFDPLKDFAPVSSLGFFDFVFCTSASSGFKTLGGFHRRRQGKTRRAECRHHQCRQRRRTCRPNCSRRRPISISPSCPFAATPEVEVSLLQGNIALMIDSYSALKGNIADGKFRALASSGAVRSESTPDLRHRAGKRRRRL